LHNLRPVFVSIFNLENSMPSRPVIGLTTYRKLADQNPPIELFGIMPSYVEAVTAAGGIPFLIPLGLPEEDLAVLLGRVDALLLPGGGDIEPSLYCSDMDATMWGVDSDRDRVEFFMVRTAVAQQKPMLAICRGLQVMNVALGGTLWCDIKSYKSEAIKHDYYRVHPRNYLSHTVEIEADSLVGRRLGKSQSWVNSLHHQGIRELAPVLRPAAYAPDGLIEAVELPDHPFAVGVQWHPENLIADDPTMLSLFTGLVETAASKN
jgi:putative glutamine amidotransferase